MLWIARATHRTLPLESIGPLMDHDDACEWLVGQVATMSHLTETERDHVASRARTAEAGMRHATVAWAFTIAPEVTTG
ncbi:hypothetical protein [Actinocorallia libanotica]|uniref:Uncharacterized protein n=1 Tax=Actinocorallia libanotica TaxID=46162 RepID=A0ABN1Q1I0_9ACTN